jgi:hypothetical protein
MQRARDEVQRHGWSLCREPLIATVRCTQMFVNPMWDNESQRIGKQKCSSKAYNLHGISDMIGFLSLLLLIFSLISYTFLSSTISTALLVLSIFSAFIGRMLFSYSWRLVEKKQFEYDYETRTASWVENGERVTYKYGDDSIETPKST